MCISPCSESPSLSSRFAEVRARAEKLMDAGLLDGGKAGAAGGAAAASVAAGRATTPNAAVSTGFDRTPVPA
jgi:hypothetical protein